MKIGTKNSMKAVLVVVGLMVLAGCGKGEYVGSCHTSLPCKWSNETGEVACRYTEAHGSHKVGDRCP